MTDHDLRETTRAPALPRPRAAADDAVALPAPSFPWPEPWHFTRGARPRTEYWDVETAEWRSRGPVLHDRTAG
jgi:hypothetical protein